MLNFTVTGIEDRRFHLKQWPDMTIREAVEISKIDMPKALDNYYQAWIDFARDENKDKKEPVWNFAPEQVNIEFPTYYGKIIAKLTDIDSDILEKIPGVWRTEFFDNYIAGMVIDLNLRAPVTYKTVNMQSFDFKGEHYEMPKDLKIFEMTAPLGGESAITFIESANIMTAIQRMEKGIEAMPLVIAIYCRKKNEQFEEQTMITRAEEFRDLTMDICWEVFFYISELADLSQRRLITFLQAMKRHMEEKRLRRNLKVLSADQD